MCFGMVDRGLQRITHFYNMIPQITWHLWLTGHLLKLDGLFLPLTPHGIYILSLMTSVLQRTTLRGI